MNKPSQPESTCIVKGDGVDALDKVYSFEIRTSLLGLNCINSSFLAKSIPLGCIVYTTHYYQDIIRNLAITYSFIFFYSDCDEWNDNNDTYRNASDRCFSKQFRRCKVATNITQIQLKETPCPTNAPVTQASSTSASTQLDTSTESIVTSAQVTQATAHTPVTDTKKPCPTSGTGK